MAEVGTIFRRLSRPLMGSIMESPSPSGKPEPIRRDASDSKNKWLGWVYRGSTHSALGRRRCQSGKVLKTAQLIEMGTMVEVQIPDCKDSSSETDGPESWAWCPGVVQVYDGITLPPGHVVVALDLASSCEGPRQVIVSASSLRDPCR